MEATAKIVEAVRAMLVPEIQQLVSRMDRIDGRLEEISRRFNDLNKSIDARFDDVNRRIDDLVHGQQTINQNLNHTNRRIDHLYDVVVKQDDYHKLESRVRQIEGKLLELAGR